MCDLAMLGNILVSRLSSLPPSSDLKHGDEWAVSKSDLGFASQWVMHRTAARFDQGFAIDNGPFSLQFDIL